MANFFRPKRTGVLFLHLSLEEALAINANVRCDSSSCKRPLVNGAYLPMNSMGVSLCESCMKKWAEKECGDWGISPGSPGDDYFSTFIIGGEERIWIAKMKKACSQNGVIITSKDSDIGY